MLVRAFECKNRIIGMGDMIQVTKLNGEKYWINPHQIETMEMNPDVTLLMLSGKKLVVKDSPEDVLTKIIEYRKKIGLVGNEL